MRTILSNLPTRAECMRACFIGLLGAAVFVTLAVYWILPYSK